MKEYREYLKELLSQHPMELTSEEGSLAKQRAEEIMSMLEDKHVASLYLALIEYKRRVTHEALEEAKVIREIAER